MTSAERVASLAVPLPVHPATPTDRGWLSGKQPLPDAVVATGTPSSSARVRSRERARPMLTPLPARITGRLAPANIRAALSTLSEPGRGRASKTNFSSSRADGASTSCAQISWDTFRATGPGRPDRASRSAASALLAMSEAVRGCHTRLTVGRINWVRSSLIRRDSSWYPPRPMLGDAVFPVMKSRLE